MVDKSFLFSRDELAMLLSKFGIDHFYGFDISGFDKSPQKYIVFMNKLVRNGIINVGQEALEFSDEVSAVFRCIANCSEVTVFYPGLSYDSVKCCYAYGDKIAISDVVNDISDKIKLSLVDAEDFYEYLIGGISTAASAEWSDENVCEPDYETRKVIEFAVESFSKEKADLLRAFDCVEWVVDSADKNSGEILQRCFLINGTEGSYIVTTDKNSAKVDLFTEEYAKQSLMNLVR